MVKRALIWPDSHVGINDAHGTSHDERLFKLIHDIAKDIHFDALYILGDFADFYSIMSHKKDPAIHTILKDELYIVHSELKKITETFKDCELHFIAGNHEHRYDRFIADKCPELFDYAPIENVLCLKDLGFKYYPYTPDQLVSVLGSDLYSRHEPYSRSAEASIRRGICSIINGHDHKIQESCLTTANNKLIKCISTGCLVNLSHPVFRYTKSRPNWQHGFSIVTVLDNGIWFNQIIQVIDYHCIIDGFLYEG